MRGRRKAMLLIGEGVDYDIYEAVGLAGLHGVVGAARYARRHRRRHARQRQHLHHRSARPDERGVEDLITQSVQHCRRCRRPVRLQNELRLSQDSLRVLADSTGGFAAVNRNDFNGAFDRIVSENSSYYLLGYYSTNDRRDGRYRKLEVRVKRPGLRVRDRATATTRRAGAPPNQPAASANAIAPALSEALGSPLPVAGMPTQGVRGALQREAPNAAIALALELDVSNLDFVEGNGTFNESARSRRTPRRTPRARCFRASGRPPTLTLKPDTYERAKARASACCRR